MKAGWGDHPVLPLSVGRVSRTRFRRSNLLSGGTARDRGCVGADVAPSWRSVSWVEIFLLACALAVDAFSVGAVVGLRHRRARQVFRLAFHFGLFQALFPLAGALASHLVLGYIEAWDHWVVFGVLSGLGIRMFVDAYRGGEDQREEVDLTKGMRLVGLSAAVSIDAAAAGLLIAATDAPLAGSVVVIGLVAAMATAVAMVGAGKLSVRVGKRAEGVGGVVLILIGARTLLSHLGWAV